jgi:hypothetical protein
MVDMKIIKVLTFLLYLAAQSSQASIKIERAKALTSFIKEEFQLELSNNQIELRFNFESTSKLPSAFAKWITPLKVAQVSFSPSFFNLDNLDELSFGLITCHELGHFLGGKPYVSAPKPVGIFRIKNSYPNMSAEGQADFFASASCFKRIKKFLNSDSDSGSDLISIQKTLDTYREILKTVEIDHDYVDATDISFGVALRTIKKPGKYPSLTCRAQTLRQGLSCQEFLPSGNCTNIVELRPSCWFIPKD